MTATTDTTPRRRLGGIVGTILTVAALAVAATVLVPAVLGFQRYVIISGSMTGTYDRGSIVYDRVVPTKDLKVGDVITYDPPAGGPDGLVTHRIHDISVKQGKRVFRTMGDANPRPDVWEFTLDQPTQARVVFHIPYVGFVLAALSMRSLRMVVIGVPALLIALAVLAGLWRDAGAEAGVEAARP
jgi:signal peptidase